MKTLITGIVFAGALAIPILETTASANHDHSLLTPGTTVVDIGNGQTEKCAADPGGHRFHANMHTGTPGNVAFAQPNNPISVTKTEDATC